MAQTGTATRGFLFTDVWRLLRDQVVLHPVPFGVSVFGAMLFAGATVLSTVVLGYVTDAVVYPTFVNDELTVSPLWWGSAAVLATVVLRSVGVVARRYFAGMTAERVQATFRNTLTDRYLRLPMAWHQQTPTGQLLAHADNDTEQMAQVLHPLPFSLGAFFLAFFSAISLLLVDPTLALVAFAVFPSLFVINRVYSNRVERPAAEAQAEVGRTSSIAHESFDGALIVKTLGRAEAEGQRFGAAANRLRDHRINVGYVRAGFEAVLDALPNIGIVIVIVAGAYRVDAGAVSRGDLVQVASLFTVLAFPMRVFGFFLESVPPSIVARRRLDLVLNEPVPEPTVRTSRLPSSPLSIEVSDVTYAYGDEPPVLTGVDFTVQPGEIVALVGSTGAGKSTLCSLVSGLLPVTKGSVKLSGVDLTDLPDPERTSAISLVFQETFLFGASVADNIDLDGERSTSEVRQAADVARAVEFIDRLPQGLETVVGERGVTLSGGQRQRIALARALLRKPRLLILDDATSAVDPKIEQEILGRLRSELTTTTLVVAQRVATIRLADRILFLGNGRIEAAGTHEELMVNPDYEALVLAYEMAGL